MNNLFKSIGVPKCAGAVASRSSALGIHLLFVCLFAGCASTGGDYTVVDPHEGFNRGSYDFTDSVDRAVLVPVARGYQKILPDPVEKGISNFFVNLQTLASSANGFLQGKPVSGGEDFARFLLNSTLGLGGLFDPATSVGLKYHQEDLGQTLAVWGWKESRYIYIPFMGPTTVRDLPSVLVSSYMPRLLLGSSYHWGISGLNVVSSRAGLLATTETRDATAIDPYTFTRDAYAQRRRFLIYDGEIPLDDLFDDFDDFADDEEP